MIVVDLKLTTFIHFQVTGRDHRVTTEMGKRRLEDAIRIGDHRVKRWSRYKKTKAQELKTMPKEVKMEETLKQQL